MAAGIERINSELLLSVQHGFKGHELPSAAGTVPGTGELLISGSDPYKIPFPRGKPELSHQKHKGNKRKPANGSGRGQHGKLHSNKAHR